MSTPFHDDDDKPRRARRRLGDDPLDAQAPGPRAANDRPADDPTPTEQGGASGLLAGGGPDQTYASGQTPCGATPLGPASCDEVVEPFDEQNRRQLVLVKNGHRYVFRYERGEETKVLAGLVEMARDPKSDLDWFDAAVLSHQLGQRMSEQLDRLRRA